MRLRNGSVANLRAGISPISSPSNTIRPDDLSISRITIIEVVDFPQPDSPTRPTLSPRAMEKLMPSTARKVSVSTGGFRLKILPSEVGIPLRGYSLTSFSTTSRGEVAAEDAVTGPGVAFVVAELDVLPAFLSGSVRDCSDSGRRSRNDTPGRGVAR